MVNNEAKDAWKGERMNAEKLKTPYVLAEIKLVSFGYSDVITTSSGYDDGLYDDDTSDRWSDP